MAQPVTVVPLGDRRARANALFKALLVVCFGVAPYLGAVVLLVVGLPLSWVWAAWAVTALVLGIGTVHWTRPPEALIGADGVSIRERRVTRFFPLHRIATLRGDAHNLEIVFEDGKTHRIAVSIEMSPPRIEALAARVRAAIAARVGGPQRVETSPLLERHGRSLAAWRKQLRKLVIDARDYRHPSLSADDIAAVLDNAEAPIEQRIGAALALSAGADAEARPRIRVAAEACANEKVRVALASLVDGEGDDQAIEEALGARRRRAWLLDLAARRR
jgi:hypothetical protein